MKNVPLEIRKKSFQQNIFLSRLIFPFFFIVNSMLDLNSPTNLENKQSQHILTTVQSWWPSYVPLPHVLLFSDRRELCLCLPMFYQGWNYNLTCSWWKWQIFLVPVICLGLNRDNSPTINDFWCRECELREENKVKAKTRISI